MPDRIQSGAGRSQPGSPARAQRQAGPAPQAGPEAYEAPEGARRPTPAADGAGSPVDGADGPDGPEPGDAERRRRRAQFLRELHEAKKLRDRVQPRRARAARMRQHMRMRTFRW